MKRKITLFRKEDIEEIVKHLPYPRRFVEEWIRQSEELDRKSHKNKYSNNPDGVYN